MNDSEKLLEIIQEGENFINRSITASDPNFKGWNSKLIRFLENNIGKDSTDCKRISKRSYSLSIIFGNTSESDFVKAFQRDLNITLAELKELVSDIDDYKTLSKQKNDNRREKKKVQLI